MTYKRANNILLALITIVCLYIVVAPLIPAISFWAQDKNGAKRHALQAEVQAPLSKKPSTPPQPNHIVIPAMLMDQPILEGSIANQYKTLNNGIWRWPRGSTPDKNSNTILIGHRFTYTNPRGVFYFLDKLQTGDPIAVFWNNHKYIYSVSSINEVPPNDITIENPSATPELTLFTCTPLWLPKDRLMVIAKLESHS